MNGQTRLLWTLPSRRRNEYWGADYESFDSYSVEYSVEFPRTQASNACSLELPFLGELLFFNSEALKKKARETTVERVELPGQQRQYVQSGWIFPGNPDFGDRKYRQAGQAAWSMSPSRREEWKESDLDENLNDCPP